MINMDTLDKEILELEKNHDTTYSTCERLAWLYIVRDHMNLERNSNETISLETSSEFISVANGKPLCSVLQVMDELMDTLKVTAPKAYTSVISKIRSI